MVPRRVLLLDQMGPPREALARMLAAMGHEVEVADASDVRDQMERFKPDAVVYSSDRRNDGMRRIVEELEATPGDRLLIALGAGSREAGPSQRVGGSVALSRPVNLEELRRRLRE